MIVMIEKTLYDYLKSKLNTSVHMEYPVNPPGKFVTIQKIDGGNTNHIKAATVSVEAYAESMYEAGVLSEEIKKVLEEMSESSSLIFSAKLGGESNSIDTENKRYRYETIWNLFY
jgi:hypothetical protein